MYAREVKPPNSVGMVPCKASCIRYLVGESHLLTPKQTRRMNKRKNSQSGDFPVDASYTHLPAEVIAGDGIPTQVSGVDQSGVEVRQDRLRSKDKEEEEEEALKRKV